MRLAIANRRQMPFLVDSVAAVFAARGLGVVRLLHPVITVRRDGDGKLIAILPSDEAGERRESLIYMEIDRADAKDRRQIVEELHAVLADARAAMQVARMQIAHARHGGHAARWRGRGAGALVPRGQHDIARRRGAGSRRDRARSARHLPRGRRSAVDGGCAPLPSPISSAAAAPR